MILANISVTFLEGLFVVARKKYGLSNCAALIVVGYIKLCCMLSFAWVRFSHCLTFYML